MQSQTKDNTSNRNFSSKVRLTNAPTISAPLPIEVESGTIKTPLCIGQPMLGLSSYPSRSTNMLNSCQNQNSQLVGNNRSKSVIPTRARSSKSVFQKEVNKKYGRQLNRLNTAKNRQEQEADRKQPYQAVQSNNALLEDKHTKQRSVESGSSPAHTKKTKNVGVINILEIE